LGNGVVHSELALQLKLSTLFHTIRHLRPIQIRYQLWYRLRGLWYSVSTYNNDYGRGKLRKWVNHIAVSTRYEEQAFTFLNVKHIFDSGLDWNIEDYGKLWVYNLNYFDFLNQPELDTADANYLISDFIEKYDSHTHGIEPYPISLRVINWIKYIYRQGITDKGMDNTIGKDIQRLLDNLEYHLLGNHLLENGFALLFAAYYFEDKDLYNKASHLIIDQLEEQIKSDGAHYELSVMYHQLMLFRVLDCIQLVRNSKWKVDSELQSLFESKAGIMLGWLCEITFDNGDIPLFNDAAIDICPSTNELSKYASALGISAVEVELSDSGYRKLRVSQMECICDVGDVSPSYQPGHSHADSLSYVLHCRQKPFIVEAGTSTYENNSRRAYERSTPAHNTVVIDNMNSTEVWGSFRVGRRAKSKIDTDQPVKLQAQHNGYWQMYGVSHQRAWEQLNNDFKITDTIKGQSGVAYLHLDHSVTILSADDKSVITCRGVVTFDNASRVEIEKYEQALGMNVLGEANYIAVAFKERLTTIISAE